MNNEELKELSFEEALNKLENIVIEIDNLILFIIDEDKYNNRQNNF